MFSLLHVTFCSGTLHSDDTELPTGLHRHDSVLHHKRGPQAGLTSLVTPAHAKMAQASTAQYWFLSANDTNPHKGKLTSTLAQRARKTWGACFQTPGKQVTLLHEESRYHQACSLQHPPSSAKFISQLLLNAKVFWQSLSHREAGST